MARVHYSRDCEPSSDSDAELRHILVRLNRGDILVCPSVDHLAHHWAGLESILTLLAERGVTLALRHSSRQPDEPVEVWAKRDLKRAAVARAHARGAYADIPGRPKKGDPELAVKLNAAGVGPETIADVLAVSTRTVARYLARQDQAAA